MATNESDEELDGDLETKETNGQSSSVEPTAATGTSTANEELDDFEFQLRQEEEERKRQTGNQQQSVPSQDGAGPSAAAASSVVLSADGKYVYTDPNDGTVYEYDYEKKAWVPRIDDDFIARYQAQYGVYDPQQQAELAQQTSQASTAPKPVAQQSKERVIEKPPEDLDEEGKKEWLKQRKKEKRKLVAERQRQQAQWFDIDGTHNTSVYVSGLPPDIELKEFEEIMSKYGVIARDLETKKPKLKLYRDDQGNPKGDGLCSYVKRESIDLATQMLDGDDVRGHKVKVEAAHFEQKGEYDPSKKRKKLSSKQKKKLLERQEKLFDWRPERMRGERPKSDCTVIIRGLFTLEESASPNFLSLQESFKAQCSKYGDVKKVVFYENNPDGIASVTFKDPEQADDCIKMMDWRHFEGKRLRAEQWDGKTKYKVEETEEDRKRRLAGWRNYLEAGAASDDGASAKDQAESGAGNNV